MAPLQMSSGPSVIEISSRLGLEPIEFRAHQWNHNHHRHQQTKSKVFEFKTALYFVAIKPESLPEVGRIAYAGASVQTLGRIARVRLELAVFAGVSCGKKGEGHKNGQYFFTIFLLSLF